MALAAGLRAETTMMVGWIAGGSWAGSEQYQELTPFLFCEKDGIKIVENDQFEPG